MRLQKKISTYNFGGLSLWTFPLNGFCFHFDVKKSESKKSCFSHMYYLISDLCIMLIAFIVSEDGNTVYFLMHPSG